jgi:hypothetical protein
LTLPRIIGITGYARHGKDTIAGVLTRELGYSRVALADQMKRLMLVLNPYLDNGGRLSDLYDEGGWERVKETEEGRRLLQVFGTEVGREGLGEDIWIGALAKATPGFYADRKIVIPDIRFTNEAGFVRKMMRGEVWGVHRPDFDNGLGRANGSHKSERDIPLLLQRAEVTFTNDAGSASEFEANVYRRVRNQLCKVAV